MILCTNIRSGFQFLVHAPSRTHAALTQMVLTSMFVHKQPSRVSRVLALQDCPPFGCYHTLSDYPLYYDPPYLPESFPEIFDNPI